MKKGGWCRNGGLPLFYCFTVQSTFTLCVGKVKFSLLLFGSFGLELTLLDSHQRLSSTKTLYYLYISDSFWSGQSARFGKCKVTENVDCIIWINLEYTGNYGTWTSISEYQDKMVLNIGKVLVKISEERP